MQLQKKVRVRETFPLPDYLFSSAFYSVTVLIRHNSIIAMLELVNQIFYVFCNNDVNFSLHY